MSEGGKMEEGREKWRMVGRERRGERRKEGRWEGRRREEGREGGREGRRKGGRKGGEGGGGGGGRIMILAIQQLLCIHSKLLDRDAVPLTNKVSSGGELVGKGSPDGRQHRVHGEEEAS